MNLKEKQDFLYYLSEVYHFSYLEKKKVLFLVTTKDRDINFSNPGVTMAKSDLLGNILLIKDDNIMPRGRTTEEKKEEEKNKPQTGRNNETKKYLEFKPPENDTNIENNNYHTIFHISYSLNNDKYIIHSFYEHFCYDKY